MVGSGEVSATHSPIESKILPAWAGQEPLELSSRTAGGDPDLWVVAKPAGWRVIPGRESASQKAVEPVPVLQSWGEQRLGQKLWVVHRIDQGTSGVVVFARTAEAHARTCQAFEQRKVKKEYDLLAEGAPGLPLLKLDSPVEGKPSLTQVSRKEQFHSAFLARARIMTGRRHQIRIHLSQAGFPLLGDTRYGGRSTLSLLSGAELAFQRPALHAARLELPAGAGQFEAPWPADFSAWVEALRGAGSSE